MNLFSKKTYPVIKWENKDLLFERQEIDIDHFNSQESLMRSAKQAVKSIGPNGLFQEWSLNSQAGDIKPIDKKLKGNKVLLEWWDQSTFSMSIEHRAFDAKPDEIFINLCLDLCLDDFPNNLASTNLYSKPQLKQDILAFLKTCTIDTNFSESSISDYINQSLSKVGFTVQKNKVFMRNLSKEEIAHQEALQEKESLKLFLKFVKEKKIQDNDFKLKDAANDFLNSQEFKKNETQLAIDEASKKSFLAIFEQEEKLKIHLDTLKSEKEYKEQIKELNIKDITLDQAQKQAQIDQLHEATNRLNQESKTRIKVLTDDAAAKSKRVDLQQAHLLELEKSEQVHNQDQAKNKLDSEIKIEEGHAKTQDEIFLSEQKIKKLKEQGKVVSKIIEDVTNNPIQEEGKSGVTPNIHVVIGGGEQKPCERVVTVFTRLAGVSISIWDEEGQDYELQDKTIKKDREPELTFKLELGEQSFKLEDKNGNVKIYKKTITSKKAQIPFLDFPPQSLQEQSLENKNSSQKILYLKIAHQKYFILANTECIFGTASHSVHRTGKHKSKFKSRYGFDPIYSDFFMNTQQDITAVSDYQGKMVQDNDKLNWYDFSTVGTRFEVSEEDHNSGSQFNINSQIKNKRKVLIRYEADTLPRRAGVLDISPKVCTFTMGDNQGKTPIKLNLHKKENSFVMKRKDDVYQHTYILMPNYLTIGGNSQIFEDYADATIAYVDGAYRMEIQSNKKTLKLNQQNHQDTITLENEGIIYLDDQKIEFKIMDKTKDGYEDLFMEK